jgi:hypothetical protein
MSVSTPPVIEAHLLSLIDGLSALTRASRIPDDDLTAAAGEAAAASAALAGSAAQVPLAAERVAAAAAGLAAAASDLKRRAALADPERRARAVARARMAAVDRALGTSEELAHVADAAADLVCALQASVAASARPPPTLAPPHSDLGLSRILRAIGPGQGGPSGVVIG